MTHKKADINEIPHKDEKLYEYGERAKILLNVLLRIDISQNGLRSLGNSFLQKN